MSSFQVQEYKDNLIKKAEELIIKGFPEKIVKLNDLLSTPQFSERSFTDVYQVSLGKLKKLVVLLTYLIRLQDLNIPVPDPIEIGNADAEKADGDEPGTKRARLDLPSGTKVMALPNGRVECNTPICELIKVVKPVIRTLVEDSNLLKMWISFMIPKIEDGNNFGVSIQEDTLAEIQSVETEAAAFFDQISRYFVSRAKVVSKVAKYPHIEDYRRAVAVI